MFTSNVGLNGLLLMNPQGQQLNNRKMAGISLSAINSVQAGFFGNSLSTGADPQLLADKLVELYGISSEEDARQLLEYLLERGSRQVFSALSDDNVDLDPYEEELKFEYQCNLEQVIPKLKESGYIADEDNIMEGNILAWDMGRLVTLVRCYYDCQIIDEGNSWKIIEHALRLCQAEYKDWREFSSAYIIGRAVSMGQCSMLTSVAETVQHLLEDELSPWTLFPLQTQDQ